MIRFLRSKTWRRVRVALSVLLWLALSWAVLGPA